MASFLRLTKLLLLLLLISNKGICAVKTFTPANGNWEDATNWSTGTAPGCGDTLILPSGKTANVTQQDNYTGCTSSMLTYIYGTLTFVTGKKLLFPCGSYVLIKSGGKIDPGNGGGSSNLIDVCGVTQWQAGDGTLSGPTCIPLGSNCPALLPVTMVNFAAEWYKHQYVNVHWTSGAEINNDHFELCRSETGVRYDLIATMPGHGNSTVTNYYSYPDDGAVNIKSRHIYYKLRQVDYDGNEAYYGPVAVRTIQKNNQFVLINNPVSKNTPLQLLLSNGEYRIVIVDAGGRTILSKDVSSGDQSALVSIPLPDLVPGLYTVVCQSEGLSGQQKMVVME